jgi:predicted transcriptional regulator
MQEDRMRDTVTVSLPPGIRRELDRIAAREGVSRSDVLRASLEDYFFVRRFRALRQRMMAAAQAQGILADEAGLAGLAGGWPGSEELVGLLAGSRRTKARRVPRPGR